MRRIALLALAAFVFGALLYGAPISLLHLAYNRIADPLAALSGAVTFYLLYGLVFAGVVVSVGGLRELLRQRRQTGGASATPDRAPILRPLLWGAAAFHLAYWVFFVDFGLTYDELPFAVGVTWASSFWPMLGWLLLRAAGVLLAVAVGTVVSAAILRFLVDRRQLAIATTLALLVSAALHVAFAVAQPRPSPPPAPVAALDSALGAAQPRFRVVLLSIDGADWRVADPLIDAGRLPNLARLVDQGVRADLTTLPDSNSAVIWASLYTGQPPSTHHLDDFYRIRLPGIPSPGLYPVHRTAWKELVNTTRRLGLGEIAAVTRADLARPLIWEVVDRAGMSLALVDGYFYSFPAMRPRHPDSVVFAYGLDWFEQSSVDPSGQPTGRQELPLYVQPVEAFALAEPFLDRPDWEWQSAVFRELLRLGRQPQLMNLYTHEPDTVQHQTWRGMEPWWYASVSAATRAELGPQIPAFYESLDRFLGDLVGQLGDDTVLILASDHGHSPTVFHDMDTQHRHGPPGMLVMSGPAVRRGVRLEQAHIYDLFPTLLYLLDLPTPEDGIGQVLEAALDPDLVRTQAQRRVATYQGAVTLDPTAAAKSAEMNRRDLEKLESLGYLR